MRHKRNTQTLSRFSAYFKATINSLAQSVIIHQRIVTTKLRAKLVRRLVDRIITLGKDVDSLSARRRAFSFLNSHSLVHKLFSEIAPMFAQKNGGYTRIIPYKRRRGDNAELVILELSARKDIPKEKVRSPKADDAAIEKHTEKPVAPKREHKEYKEKESKKPSKKMLGGIGKIFNAQRDSL
ncbi:MAG: 50S ribosomal protein L17 [Candidatus Omnitrophica bacterium CG1_02_44_16]|nr:MAG: 50S ribosomal protein L17 [Candidatus Omnitrophica bacterium CG1_02_44_16]PIY82798.1 MAG: 50S ribosomal protein L17 [Candidatus Omnitrophica bacterium CG_4_10_14_0_8_um_filter_44_12]PIZ84045.1 MAG: 50S ribosomal protein L17 [Candidatus Omnitrophica bacterium CG_4_10_14_0_2_um_filter_44_9]